jgi:hypothetical protein
MDRDNRNDLFSQIEYLLIRLLLIALLLIGGYKLLEREIYEKNGEPIHTPPSKREIATAIQKVKRRLLPTCLDSPDGTQCSVTCRSITFTYSRS